LDPFSAALSSYIADNYSASQNTSSLSSSFAGCVVSAMLWPPRTARQRLTGNFVASCILINRVSTRNFCRRVICHLYQEGIAPAAARRYAPPMAVRRWHIVSPPIRPPWIQKSRRIYVRPRTGPQSAHLWWWPAVAKLQASSVPIAQAGSCAMGQTDGQADRRTDRAIPK